MNHAHKSNKNYFLSCTPIIALTHNTSRFLNNFIIRFENYVVLLIFELVIRKNWNFYLYMFLIKSYKILYKRIPYIDYKYT